MDDVVTTSISKGCFLFKPQKDNQGSPRKKRKKDKLASLNSVDFFQTFSLECQTNKNRRYETYTNCWETLENQILTVQDTINDKIFVKLLQFVERVSSQSHTTGPISEIPTAVLVTGVNLPDHNTVFTKFVNKLKECTTQFAAQLQSKHCSNLKFMMKTVFDEIYFCSVEEGGSALEDEDYDDDEDSIKTRKKKSIFKEYTFDELYEWYEEQEKVNVHGIETGKKPMVFILEDFERFQPSVLQDFILIFSEHTKEIPIILIFGVATTVSAIHKFLPHSVSARLSIEKFQAQPSLVCLTDVVDQVLITQRNSFKLGPDVSRLLYEHFLYHDFSIKNFVQALKFCVMEHFNNNIFSILCSKDISFMKSYIDNLNLKLITEIKKVPSVSRFIDKKSKDDQIKLNKDTNNFKKVIYKLILDLQIHERMFYPVVKCLHIFTCKLPGYPLGKRLRDTYEYCMCAPKITKEKKYETSMTLTRMLSRIELKNMLDSSVEVLRKTVEEEGIQEMERHLKTLKRFQPKFDNLDNLSIILAPNVSSPEVSLPKPVLYKSRYEMQEKMKQAVKEKRKESPFEKLRNEIVDCVEELFREFLHSPMYMPFHEVFYYNEMRTVKMRVDGTPRIGTQKALSDPHFYLKCACCMDSQDDIKDSQPDICILYKLHLECGKLINLYDWLQAYMTVIDSTLIDDKKKKSKAKNALENQLQARFIRGVSELQFLGFIKSTKRKTDHVQRLTWGGC